MHDGFLPSFFSFAFSFLLVFRPSPTLITAWSIPSPTLSSNDFFYTSHLFTSFTLSLQAPSESTAKRLSSEDVIKYTKDFIMAFQEVSE